MDQAQNGDFEVMPPRFVRRTMVMKSETGDM
jgi:hypothetical protein